MSWFIEHLHRDGSVALRLPIPAGGSLTIGRALDNDLVVDDPHVAAYHARVELDSDDHAALIDLNTTNGIVPPRGKRAASYAIDADKIYRLGSSAIRVRSSAWALAPELALSRRAVWPIALGMVLLMLAHAAWNLWLGDVRERAPSYLSDLSGQTIAVCAWSAMYALLGRLLTGVDRFFSHLAIAAIGYLALTLILNGLETLAFSASWLWPERITQPVVVVIAALVVRAHLRLADPRHWPTSRIAVIVIAIGAITVPLAQKWISHQRLTDVQTLGAIKHPALRVASPITVPEFAGFAEALKLKVDQARRKDNANQVSDYDYDGDAGVSD